MRLKISIALIGFACIALITTAIYLGTMNWTELFVITATIFVALVGGFHLLDENGNKNGPTD